MFFNKQTTNCQNCFRLPKNNNPQDPDAEPPKTLREIEEEKQAEKKAQQKKVRITHGDHPWQRQRQEGSSAHSRFNGCHNRLVITSSYHKLIIDHPIVDQPHNQDDIALLIAMVMILAAATGTVFFKLYVIDEPPNPNISTFRPLPMQVEPC